MCTQPIDFNIALPSLSLQVDLDDAEIPDIRMFDAAIITPPRKRKTLQPNRRRKRGRKDAAHTEEQSTPMVMVPNILVHEEPTDTLELEPTPVDVITNNGGFEQPSFDWEADTVEEAAMINDMDEHMLFEEDESVNGLDEQGELDEIYSTYQTAVLSGIADFYQIGEGLCVIRGWNTKKNEPTVRVFFVRFASSGLPQCHA